MWNFKASLVGVAILAMPSPFSAHAAQAVPKGRSPASSAPISQAEEMLNWRLGDFNLRSGAPQGSQAGPLKVEAFCRGLSGNAYNSVAPGYSSCGQVGNGGANGGKSKSTEPGRK